MTAKAEMLPVLLQASYVESQGDVKLGTLWDLCSTDDYITFKKAEELGLAGEDFVLTIEGVGGVETTINTKLFNVPVFMQTKKMKKCKYIMFQCYGMEKIADAATPPDEDSYRELCTKFNVRVDDMARPHEVDLLISMRRNRFHPKPVKTKGNMTLYKGPFGSVFGGTEPDLVFEPYVPMSVDAVPLHNVERKLQNLFDKGSIPVKGEITRMEVDDWSEILSSVMKDGVLLNSRHQPDLEKNLELKKLMIGGKDDLEQSMYTEFEAGVTLERYDKLLILMDKTKTSIHAEVLRGNRRIDHLKQAFGLEMVCCQKGHTPPPQSLIYLI